MNQPDDHNPAPGPAHAAFYGAHGLVLRPRGGSAITGLLTGIDLPGPGVVVADSRFPDQEDVPKVSESRGRCCYGALGTWGGMR